MSAPDDPHLEVRSATLELGKVIAGTPYRAAKLLGLGGMGAVYEVLHTELGKHFVLKLLYPLLAAQADFAARLKREQRALGRLEHPNIVAVTDAGSTADGVPYFVMERLQGAALSSELRRRAPFVVVEALDVTVQVLDGLSAAHALGIVHRDVKPANVFLTRAAGVKLLDFGIAKDLRRGDGNTRSGTLLCTPRYMSPEQAGDLVDHRSDLYSVGLLLWHMIGGLAPYRELHGARELVHAQRTRDLPRLSEAAPGIHPALDDLTAALLAKDPEGRPQSAAAVAAILRRVRAEYEPPSHGPATRLAGYDAPTLGAAPPAPPAPTSRPVEALLVTRAETPRALGQEPDDESGAATLVFEAGSKPPPEGLSPPRARAGVGLALAGAAALSLGVTLGALATPGSPGARLRPVLRAATRLPDLGPVAAAPARTGAVSSLVAPAPRAAPPLRGIVKVRRPLRLPRCEGEASAEALATRLRLPGSGL